MNQLCEKRSAISFLGEVCTINQLEQRLLASSVELRAAAAVRLLFPGEIIASLRASPKGSMSSFQLACHSLRTKFLDATFSAAIT